MKRDIGQPWFEVAAERIRAGEDEEKVMRDYGLMGVICQTCQHWVVGIGCGKRRSYKTCERKGKPI
jgi:hypothetical protein